MIKFVTVETNVDYFNWTNYFNGHYLKVFCKKCYLYELEPNSLHNIDNNLC